MGFWGSREKNGVKEDHTGTTIYTIVGMEAGTRGQISQQMETIAARADFAHDPLGGAGELVGIFIRPENIPVIAGSKELQLLIFGTPQRGAQIEFLLGKAESQMAARGTPEAESDKYEEVKQAYQALRSRAGVSTDTPQLRIFRPDDEEEGTPEGVRVGRRRDDTGRDGTGGRGKY